MDMTSRERRLDLIDRYNASVGPPGPLSAELQRRFVEDELESALVEQYVRQCEDIIASRSSMKREETT